MILQFKPKRKPTLPPKQQYGKYFCAACEGESFEIWSDGIVYCVKCATPIRNLIVTMV